MVGWLIASSSSCLRIKWKKVFPKSKSYPGKAAIEFFYIDNLKARLWTWVFPFRGPVCRTGSFSVTFWQALSSGRPWHWSWCRGQKTKCHHRYLFLANCETERHDLGVDFFSSYDLYHLYHLLLSFNTYTYTYAYINLLTNK